ncbi:hypothetical protein STEG23_001579 [Scotinomys teguina]
MEMLLFLLKNLSGSSVGSTGDRFMCLCTQVASPKVHSQCPVLQSSSFFETRSLTKELTNWLDWLPSQFPGPSYVYQSVLVLPSYVYQSVQVLPSYVYQSVQVLPSYVYQSVLVLPSYVYQSVQVLPSYVYQSVQVLPSYVYQSVLVLPSYVYQSVLVLPSYVYQSVLVLPSYVHQSVQVLPSYVYQSVQVLPSYVYQSVQVLPSYVHQSVQVLPSYVYQSVQVLPSYVYQSVQLLPSYVYQSVLVLPSYVYQSVQVLPSYVHQSVLVLPSYVHQSVLVLPSYVHQSVLVLPSYVYQSVLVLPSYVHQSVLVLQANASMLGFSHRGRPSRIAAFHSPYQRESPECGGAIAAGAGSWETTSSLTISTKQREQSKDVTTGILQRSQNNGHHSSEGLRNVLRTWTLRILMSDHDSLVCPHGVSFWGSKDIRSHVFCEVAAMIRKAENKISTIQRDLESSYLCVGPGTGEALQQVQAAVQVALPLGPYDPADLMVFEVLVVDKDAVLNLWQAPIGEPQKRPLGFWSKVIPSSADNYSFESQLLACY